MNAREIHEKLALQGIRIFKIRLNPRNEEHYFIHADKTVADWRSDIASFRDTFAVSCIGNAEDMKTEDMGWADSDVHNGLYGFLHNNGYVELTDVVADVFEGRVTNESSRIVDDPDHDDIQADGFGHYGWESKPFNEKATDDTEPTNHTHVNIQVD